MNEYAIIERQRLSNLVGWAMLVTIAIGMISAFTVSSGIDINMSADIAKTAETMLESEEKLRGTAYISLLVFALGVFVNVGLFVILKQTNVVLALWSMLVAISAGLLSVLGAVYAMNAALIGSNDAYQLLGNTDQRLLLTAVQVTADYTSFHLSLVLSSAANVGIYWLFVRSALIPKFISGWGVFASLFVLITIVARDFIPMFTHDAITIGFMLSNLVASLMLGFYLGIKGVALKPGE